MDKKLNIGGWILDISKLCKKDKKYVWLTEKYSMMAWSVSILKKDWKVLCIFTDFSRPFWANVKYTVVFEWPQTYYQNKNKKEINDGVIFLFFQKCDQISTTTTIFWKRKKNCKQEWNHNVITKRTVQILSKFRLPKIQEIVLFVHEIQTAIVGGPNRPSKQTALPVVNLDKKTVL